MLYSSCEVHCMLVNYAEIMKNYWIWRFTFAVIIYAFVALQKKFT
jgi:hypothetical protein